MSAGLLAAIFVSNLPEAIGGATDMRRQHARSRRQVIDWVWIAGSVVRVRDGRRATRSPTSLRTTSRAGINGFAAGALLVMLVDSMIPEATEQAGRTTGLVTALGFAVAAGLSFA